MEFTTVTKADIVDILAKGTGLTKIETAAVVDGMIATISYALKNGEPVDFRGFGRFHTVHRAPRIGRNPKTGIEVPIPARKMPVFRVSKHLRDFVNAPVEDDEEFEILQE
jgi:DNA-binding protein HU-beta